ncbi:AraC family transcriptional regulator [Vagococcus penaei]|uniref:AraC family transcriptional regulator n=1 Tax=Vagococcus penaei TaxID=633807 RepID=A0A1Q2D768_9ENTE|nr:AraC family transcriptional regulator [Vagococcus penaei]AQP54187.1 AraC family transcriptional regulator [Vagococcus penaei]RST99968.1 AraC family transcriptional regulator [Vagococcus penaei]
MSLYLELLEWPFSFPFRTLENEGEVIVPPHWHKEIEVILVTEGSVNIGYNQQLFQVHRGEVFVFGSGESHYFLASPGSHRYVFQFDLELFRETYLKGNQENELIHLFETRENHSRQWPSHVAERVVTYLRQLYDEMATQQVGYEFAVVGYLNQLIATYYRDIPEKAHVLTTGNFVEAVNHHETLERLNKIFNYIESHYMEGISLDDVAQAVGFSPYYFARFFKKNTGQTFMQFLNDYRISQAKYILSHKKIPMIEVAELSGFNSVKTFHHVFKEHVGLSPLKYQKTIFGNN